MRAHSILTRTIILAAICIFVPASSFAEKGGKDKDKGGGGLNRVRLKENLSLVVGSSAELASAEGRVHYDGKLHPKKAIVKRQLKVRVLLPAAPSLGLADAASAALLPLHLEVSREGTVISDCLLAFQSEMVGETAEEASRFQFRLHSHVNPKGREKLVKGSCELGSPVLEANDAITIFANVGETRVDILQNASAAAVPTPTPTATATPSE